MDKLYDSVMRSYKSGILYRGMNLYLRLAKHIMIILLMIGAWYIYKGKTGWEWPAYVMLGAVLSVLLHYIVVVRCIRFVPGDILRIYRKDLGGMTMDKLEPFFLKYYGAFREELIGCRLRFTGQAEGDFLKVISPDGIEDIVIREISLEGKQLVVRAA